MRSGAGASTTLVLRGNFRGALQQGIRGIEITGLDAQAGFAQQPSRTGVDYSGGAGLDCPLKLLRRERFVFEAGQNVIGAETVGMIEAHQGIEQDPRAHVGCEPCNSLANRCPILARLRVHAGQLAGGIRDSGNEISKRRKIGEHGRKQPLDHDQADRNEKARTLQPAIGSRRVDDFGGDVLGRTLREIRLPARCLGCQQDVGPPAGLDGMSGHDRCQCFKMIQRNRVGHLNAAPAAADLSRRPLDEGFEKRMSGAGQLAHKIAPGGRGIRRQIPGGAR